MNDPGLMRFSHGIERLEHIVDGLRNGQNRLIFEHVVKVCTFEVFHGDVGRAIGEFSYVVDRGNVFASQFDTGARFAQESFDGLRIIGCRREHEFDGPPLLEVQVHRGNDHTHCATSQKALDAVLSIDDIADFDLEGR